MQVKIASSLDKVFPKISPKNVIANASILRNERFNFQICLYNDSDLTQKEVKIKPIGQIARNCEMRVVENVPAQLTEYITKDDYYIFEENADRVYPDLLRPFEYGDLILPAKQWRCVWCTIHDKKGLKAGEHTLRFAVSAPEQEDIQVELKLDVVDELLPENDLLYTNWFHYDSIANFYGVKPWSKRYYKLLSSYVDTATLHGMNLMYTPIFTPPLDTKGGWERLDVQLVKVSVDDNENYEFDFSRLDYFLDFCSSRGIKYFEMSHLATQWGAEACPKIMAHTPSGYRRIFGWDTPSFGDKYKAFIARFLPELDAFLKQKGIADRVFFHISDEPAEEQFADYKLVADYIKSFIGDYKVLDASSTTSNEIIDIPILSTTHIPENAAENVWAYYCLTACDNYVSNRFFNMPSQRNRILGMQLYEQGRKGFLHWGFNFYNTILSYRSINPFLTTDAGGGFPAGDSFVVYPGKNGALDSLRLEVFFEGLQDRLALRALEKYVGREAVTKLLHDEGVYGWKNYPRSASWHIEFRHKINRMLKGFKK